MTVAVLGAGAWGTVLAVLAHENKNRVVLWGHHPAHVRELAVNRENRRHLPGVPLPPEMAFEINLSTAIAKADCLVLSVPSVAFRQVAAAIQDCHRPLLTSTKGIEAQSGLTMSGILAELNPRRSVAALSGPSLAAEVARGTPTAVVIASQHAETAAMFQEVFHRPVFRVYTTPDILGVELGGALKNVIAIAAGVCDGCGFGDNSKAALVTRALAEIRRLGVACGAQPETFSGLSGLGDLTVTCFSRLSRNRAFGERLGKGEPLSRVLATGTDLVEGYPTARSAHELASRLRVPAPVIAEVHAMLFGGKELVRAVRDLLNRDLKAED